MNLKFFNYLFLYFIFSNFIIAEIYQNVGSWLQLREPPVKKQDSGVCIVYARVSNKDKIFSIPGGGCDFQIYDIEKDTWSYTSDLPFTATSGTSMCWDGNNYIYIFSGGTTFYRYEINTENFTRLADLPEVNLGGGSIVYVVEENNFNCCYAIFGGTNCFYRYNIQQDKWEKLSSAGKAGPGSCLLWTKDQYIYVSRLGSSSNGNLKRYNILTTSWESLQSLENNWGAGGSLCWNKNLSEEVFAIRGANSTDFYKYVISENKWYKLENLPVTVGNNTGNRLATVGDYIYARLGSNNSTDSFWRYRITDTKPPGNITFLDLQNTEEGSVVLSWIVPGNDNYLGDFEGSFIVKFSSSESQFFSQKDTFEIGITTFAKQGDTFEFKISNLQDKTSYYFLIQSKDNYNNFSEPLYRLFYVEKIPLPEKPKNIYAKANSATEVSISWESSFCFGYRIEVSTCLPYIWNFKEEISSEVNFFLDKNLLPSTTYYYRIIPLNSKKQPYYDSSSDVVYTLTYPLSPVNFQADEVGVSSISWSWNNLRNYDGVKIYDFKTNQLIIQLPSNINSYTEKNLLPNTLYERKIVSFNKTGESLNYSYFGVYTLAACVSNLKIKNVGVDFVELEWYKNNPDYTKYGVFYSLDNFELNFSTYVCYEDNFTSNSIIVENLKPNKNYIFRICAYNQQGIRTEYVEVSTKTKDIQEYFEIFENFDNEFPPFGWKLYGVERTQTRAYSLPYSISNFTSSNYLYTPLIKKPIKVSFMLYTTGSSSIFRVQLSTSQTETAFWFTIYSTNSVANNWQKHEVELYGYENIYLRMNRSSGQNSFNLDDFRIYCIQDNVIPSAISDLKATVTQNEGEVLLSWTTPYKDKIEPQEFIGRFIIKISSQDIISSNNFNDDKFYTLSISTFIPSNTKVSLTLQLNPGQTYYFAIKSEDIHGNRSIWHSFLEAQVNEQAFCFTFDKSPQTPKEIKAQKLNSNSILISWDTTLEQDLDYYVLEYKKDAQQEVFVATITKNTSFIHNNLENSCSYYYRIKAVDKPPTVLESQYSDFVCIYLDKPKNLLKNEFFNFWDIFLSSSSPKFWSWSGSAKNIKSSTDSLVGIYSAEITLTSSLETLSQLNIPLATAQSYYVETWVKGKGIINIGIVKGNNSLANYSDDYIIDTSSWIKISYFLKNDKEGLGGIKLRFTKNQQIGEKIYIGGVWFSNENPPDDSWLSENFVNYIYDLKAKEVPYKQGEVILEWTTLYNEPQTIYRIKYSTYNFLSFSENEPYNIELVTTTSTSNIYLTITGLKPSATYYFAVIFKDSQSWSFWFKNEFINCENYCYVKDLMPLLPQNISIESFNKKLKLSWNHPQPEDDIQLYKIYFSTYEFNSISEVCCLEVYYPLNSVLITGLKNNLTYYFRLSTLDKQSQDDCFYGDALESKLSDLIFSTPKIPSPKELYCVHFGTSVVLSWSHTLDICDENFFGYNIYRSTSLDTFLLISSNFKNNIYIDKEILPNKGYYYFVTACDDNGEESSPSNLVYTIFDTSPPRFSFVSNLKQEYLLNKNIIISLKVEDDMFEVGDKKGKIISIVGKYKEINNTKEFDMKFTPEISFACEYIGNAFVDLSVFEKSLEGIEYYFIAKDEYNTTRYPPTGYQRISFSKDIPEKKIVTPKNKDLIFGVEAEEVEIRDAYGNEVWRGVSNGSIIVWRTLDKTGKEVESGVYIYQIKTKDKKIKYGVVVVVK